MPAVRILPSPRIDILSSTKQALEQRNSFAGAFLLGLCWSRLWNSSRNDLVHIGLGNRDAMSGEKPPKSYILFPQPMILRIAPLERHRF
jgi:hypothetical protein